MSDYLLVGIRIPAAAELSPDAVGRDIVAACSWQRALLRWGLLRWFAIGAGVPVEPTACLIVQVSSRAAADVLAVGWERAAGYLVTALPLVEAAPVGALPAQCTAGAAV